MAFKKATKTEKATKQLVKDTNETPANRKQPKLTEAEARKQVMADRMAHARAVRQAKIAAAAKPEMTLKEVKESKKAAAEARLAATSKGDREERTEKSLEQATELIQPAGHGPVGYYYRAECPNCGTIVQVPVDERGKRIPLGDLRLTENGVLEAPAPKQTSKTGRVKRDLTDEQRKAIADRLQGARAAKLGITLEGLRALKLRPGTKPTPAQLKKYGVKRSSK